MRTKIVKHEYVDDTEDFMIAQSDEFVNRKELFKCKFWNAVKERSEAVCKDS
jgi:hypothetical protein